jgi:aryl-alcohol dehydrogenase-like predicted oxidoreductase
MTPIYGTPDPTSAVGTIHRAPELGIDFIDTSDAYGAGSNEELVGRALAGHRNKYVLATKFGNVRLPDGTPSAEGRPEYVIQACDKSLKRLGTDFIDLYYQHRVDDKVPIEDTVGAMATLVRQGKVRHLGLSEAAPSTIRRAHKVHPIAALQTEYSLWTRDAEGEILGTCKELGIGFVAYSPLGRGMLTGTITGAESLSDKDNRRNMPRFQGENLQHNLALAEELKKLAAIERCTPAQLAIAWVLEREAFIVALPGSSRKKWLEDNANAVEVKLSQTTRESLDRIFKPGVARGTRYGEAMMKRVGL